MRPAHRTENLNPHAAYLSSVIQMSEALSTSTDNVMMAMTKQTATVVNDIEAVEQKMQEDQRYLDEIVNQ